MKLPGTEKIFPAIRYTLAAISMVALVRPVLADAEADYKTGLAAYRENNVVDAMDALKKAADAGHAGAQAVYGEILDSAELDEQAAEYLRKSAAQSNPDGMYNLAKMYLTGEAVAPDATTAPRLLRAAAETGHRSAILALSSAFIRGDERAGGKDQSSPEARQYITKGAEFGDIAAMEALRDGYRNGKHGFPIDAEKAQEWDTKIAVARSIPRKGGRK